jgi:hypothetical protein
MRMIYVFRPIIICIIVVVAAGLWVASDVASTPSDVNASASAFPALTSVGISDRGSAELMPTFTPVTMTLKRPTRGLPGGFHPSDQDSLAICTHRAFSRVVTISSRRSAYSGSRRLMIASYWTPENSSNCSAMRSTCSEFSSRHSLNFSSVSFASNARASAAATLSSDSLWISPVALFATLMHQYSIPNPAAINTLAVERITFSQREIPLAKAYSATNSSIIPARIMRVARPDQRSLFSSAVLALGFSLLASVRSSYLIRQQQRRFLLHLLIFAVSLVLLILLWCR